MKKKNWLFLLFLWTALCSFCLSPVMAAGNGRVYDEYGALSQSQIQTLDTQIAQIYDSSSVDVAILITPDISSSDARKYAAEFMQQREIGAEGTKNGAILMHQPDGREITIVFRGEIQNAYSTDIQDQILEDCKVYLRENQFFEGYQAVLQDISNSAARAVSGKTVREMDIRGESILSSIPGFGILSFIVTAIPVLFMTLFQRGKMKTIVQQGNANSYVPVNGFALRQKQDRFIRTVTTRTRKPKEEHHSGGGGGGSFSAGGESFSGSSSKY